MGHDLTDDRHERRLEERGKERTLDDYGWQINTKSNTLKRQAQSIDYGDREMKTSQAKQNTRVISSVMAS